MHGPLNVKLEYNVEIYLCFSSILLSIFLYSMSSLARPLPSNSFTFLFH